MIQKADIIAKRLEEARENPDADDPLIIAPWPVLKEDERGAGSIDLRLGCWFVSFRRARLPSWKAESSHLDPQLTKTDYVPFGGAFYIHPRSFVLGITLEWIRIPGDLGGYVTGMSRWGRRGLIIATAAGVHPGFKGCLTLEMSNVGDIPIELRPGSKICQLFFHSAEGDKNLIDHSQFAGQIRPDIGRLPEDPFVDMLLRAYNRQPNDPGASSPVG